MKLIKYIVLLVIAGLLGAGGFMAIEYQQVLKEVAPIQTMKFNDQEINYKSALVEYRLLYDLVPIHREFQNLDTVELISNTVVNTITVNDTDEIEMTYPNQEIVTLIGSQILELTENGTYLFNVTRTTPDKTVYIFRFSLTLESYPAVSISNPNPVQGELLIVKIDNIKKDSTIVIESNFRPSAVIQIENTARFYLPMAYREEAKIYPLIIRINDEEYTYQLDVKTYAFKQLHFTVSASVTSGTVGNTDAVDQFKATIYPLYETAEPEEYWEGNFVLPVEGARISSTFGEMRFVNDATTPSRHVGIDYAVACGTDVVASNAGKVVYAGFLTIIGNTVVIDHGLGLKTFYEHMDDIVIAQGDMVEKGQVIGHVGTTGYSTGCHLHFQSMVLNNSINPEFLYSISE